MGHSLFPFQVPMSLLGKSKLIPKDKLSSLSLPSLSISHRRDEKSSSRAPTGAAPLETVTGL